MIECFYIIFTKKIYLGFELFGMEEQKLGMEEFEEIKFSLPQTEQSKQLGFGLESTDIKNSHQILLGGVLKHFLIQRISIKELVFTPKSPPLQNCVGCLLCYVHSHKTPVAMTVVACTEN